MFGRSMTFWKFLLLSVLFVPLWAQTDEDDQFKDEVFDRLKVLLDKVNILEQKFDQLTNEMKTAREKISSLEGERSNKRPSSGSNPLPVEGNSKISPTPSIDRKRCPDQIDASAPCTSVDGFGCYCIFSSRNAKTFNAAKKHCNDNQMELVAIETPEEQLVLNNLLKKKFHDWPFWTSGSDEQVEGLWLWTPSGQRLNYTNWQEGQPDNEGNIQHALMLMKTEPFKWFDGMKRQNGQELGANYICES